MIRHAKIPLFVIYLASVFSAAESLAQQIENTKHPGSVYLGVGPVIKPELIAAHFSAGIISKSGWGFGGDYSSHRFKNGFQDIDSDGSTGYTSRGNLFLIKQIQLRQPNLRVHLALGSSVVEKRENKLTHYQGQAYTSSWTSTEGGVGAKAALWYRINKLMALSAGMNFATSSSMSDLRGEVSLSMGYFKKMDRYRRPVHIPLEQLSIGELTNAHQKAVSRYRKGRITGGILVGLAIVSAFTGLIEYQNDGFLSQPTGVVLIGGSLTILAPIGTANLIVSSHQQKKSQKILKLLQ